MMYLGDFAEDATLYFCFNTFNAEGASEDASANGSAIWVYKDKATGTEVQTGVTVDEAYDGLAGVHNVEIILTNAFYVTGADYHIILKAATIDTQTVNACLATFSIENRFMRGTDGANTVAQTGDSYAIVNSGTHGNAKLVRSTTPGNALDVSATGEAGLDFNNIKVASGATTLTNITVPTVTTVGTVTNGLTTSNVNVASGVVESNVKQLDGNAVQQGTGHIHAFNDAGAALATASNVSTAHSTTDAKIDTTDGLIGGLNDFDPANDTVAAVTAVGTVTTVTNGLTTGNVNVASGIVEANIIKVDGTAQRATDLAEISQYYFANSVTLTDVIADNCVVAQMLATSGDISGYSSVTDAQQSIRDNMVTLGPGAISWPYTLRLDNEDTGDVMADVDVHVTTDEAGSNVIASGRTNQNGVVTFNLDAGTVYLWRQKTNFNFTNPDTETVTAS